MQGQILFASLITSIAPMVAYLLIIWWMDRNEKEPLGFLFCCFVFGGIGSVVLALIGSVSIHIVLQFLVSSVGIGSGVDQHQIVTLFNRVVNAPLTEELAKGILLLIVSKSKKFDGVVDGVVYGGAIGLGFGMTENFMYFLGAKPDVWLSVVIVRTLFSAVLHGVATATLGGFIGLAKFRPCWHKIFLISTGYFIAAFIHFVWNLFLSFQETILLGFLSFFLSFIAWIAIFQIALYKEGKTIQKELLEESINGIIPSEHMNYLPFIFRRNLHGWCPKTVNQKEYVKIAVILALRKGQVKKMNKILRSSHEQEIEILRNTIKEILCKNAAL